MARSEIQQLALERIYKITREEVHGDNGRSRRLKLTASGHRLLIAATPIWKRTHAEIERQLVGPGADRLRADLRALCGSAP